jgi:aspartate racemase
MIEKTIGVVAGVGPFAGLDLLKKILDQTAASTDQEHLTVLSVSRPGAIPDRTRHLLDPNYPSPAPAITAQLRLLEDMGAEVAAIPCNTSHCQRIFDPILDELCAARSHLKVLNMLDEVAQFIISYHPMMRRVGVLATTGTCQTGVYQQALKPLTVLVPRKRVQENRVHPAIYNEVYGIKATGRDSTTARDYLMEGIEHLRGRGAEAIILGCTELPLIFREAFIAGTTVIDPTLVLARALVREANPAKLKPYDAN